MWRRMKEVLPLLTALNINASKRDGEAGSIIVLSKVGGGPPNPGSSTEDASRSNASASRMPPGGKADSYGKSGSTGGNGSSHGHSSAPLSRTTEEKDKEEANERTKNRKVAKNASSASIASSKRKADSTNGRRRLTEEEAQQVQKLISEGMAPRFARAEVLGEEGLV